MTHPPETGAENRLHFSGAGSWSMCHGYNNAIQYNEIIYNAHKVEKSNLRCGQSLGGRRCGRWL